MNNPITREFLKNKRAIAIATKHSQTDERFIDAITLYDDKGRRRELTDFRIAQEPMKPCVYNYDDNDRLVSSIDSDGEQNYYEYDNNGNVKRSVCIYSDGIYKIEINDYDDENHLIRQIDMNGSIDTWSYEKNRLFNHQRTDSKGKVVINEWYAYSDPDENGNYTTFVYDNGDLTKVIKTDKDSKTLDVTIKAPSGELIRHATKEYDGDKLIKEVVIQPIDSVSEELRSYNENGTLSEVIYNEYSIEDLAGESPYYTDIRRFNEYGAIVYCSMGDDFEEIWEYLDVNAPLGNLGKLRIANQVYSEVLVEGE